MTSPYTSAPATAANAAGPATPARSNSGRAPPPSASALPRWFFVLAGLVALHLSHPLTWNLTQPPLCVPALGVGVALTFWLGPAGAVLSALDLLLVRVLASEGDTGLLSAWIAAGITLGELLLAWWWYLHLARGNLVPNDPRSATYFLLIVPGAALALGAVARAAFLPDGDFWDAVVRLWLTHALSVLAMAPLVLVAATPWLTRQGLLPAVARDRLAVAEWAEHWSWGALIESAGLALGTALLGLILAGGDANPEVHRWHLWGVLLLLVVWASLRQGLRGGTLAASSAALAALGMTVVSHSPPLQLASVQGNLLALCTTALLVGPSSGWIRASEARYRQVIGHIPVILYSARLIRAPGPGARPEALVTLVSPASRQVFGCEPEELLGDYENWLRRVHPQDRELLVAALTQLCMQAQPVSCEYRLNPELLPASGPPPPASATPLPHPVGAPIRAAVAEERWVRDTLGPHHSEDGKLVGWESVVEDITAQRTLSASLRRTTTMLHALVANLPAGVFFVQGATGQPVLVNARARTLLGQREDPSAGLSRWPELYRLYRTDGTLYPWEELPVARALHRGLTSMRDDIVVHRADGRWVPLVAWGAPVDLGGPGQTDAAVWVFEDRTALQQAEAARLDSEARLRAVIETMAEGLIVQDPSGAVVEWNLAACDILGVTPEQMQTRSSLGPEQGCLREDGSPFPRDEQPDRVCLRTYEPVRNVVLGVPVPPPNAPPPGGAEQGGEVRWILVNAMPLPRPTRQRGVLSYRAVLTFADITAYREALGVLRASEEKYRVLVETLPLMLLQLDRAGRITYHNSAAEPLVEEAQTVPDPGVLWERLVHADDLPAVQAMQRQALEGQPGRAEFRFRLASGTEKVGYALSTPLRHDGQVVGSTLLIVDLTLQRRLEQELGRVQRLELVGKLAGGIVHDVNNLLTVVLGLTRIAQAGLPQEHAVQAELRRISEAANQASQLTGQLLTFSKQRRLQFRPVLLDRVVARTLDLLRGILPETIQVERELGAGSMEVLADEGQLQQVLMNLCLNARDAMTQGGRLLVRTSPEDKPLPTAGGNGTTAGRWLRLSVQDSGEGMTPAVLAQIFDPFFSTRERGTGLGLSVVRQLVEGFSGRVEVWSEAGQGTRLDVWLPALSEEGRPVRPDQAVTNGASPGGVDQAGA